MAAADGKWDVLLRTPMGDQNMTFELVTDGDKVSGKANTPFGPLDFEEGTVSGDDLEWMASTAVPMPMTLKFNVKVEGDAMSGNVNAGALGDSPLTGTRSA